MTRGEAEVKIAKAEKKIEALNKRLEYAADYKEKIDITSSIFNTEIYKVVLETYKAMDDEEYSKFKAFLQTEYEEQKNENKKIVEALKNNEVIAVTKYTFNVLQYYKKIIEEMNIKKVRVLTKNKAIRFVA